MATHPLQDFLRRLRRARSVAEGGHLTDAQLLERFAKQRDEAAFEVLVWRHGPLVLNVARRLLRHAADIEDVFQATFLTLARKASAIRRGASVDSWLYKVAYRLALRVRQAAARRECRQKSGIETVAAPVEHGDTELAAAITEEVSRLPERYRAVVVLCYLQGATTEEAARVLGCPRGTVLSRLASARQRLRQRLLRRGIAPVVALAAVSFGDMASAMPSAALVTSLVGAALPFAAGGASIPLVSTQAAVLARGALQTMMWNKIKIVGAMACVIALAGTGAGWLTRGRADPEPATSAAPQPPPPALAAAEPERIADKTTRINKLRQELQKLDEQRNDLEQQLYQQNEHLHLKLMEDEEEQQRIEREYSFARERERVRLKSLDERLLLIDKDLLDSGLKNADKQKKELVHLEELIQRFLTDMEKRMAERERERSAKLVQVRLKVRDVTEALRGRERQFTADIDDLKIKRQMVADRLRRLEMEESSVSIPDALRDVEGKLDALRRDVGELRRALDRKKER